MPGTLGQMHAVPRAWRERGAASTPRRFIEVLKCGRVGRLENPFHFVKSEPPRPGTAFASQAAQPAPGRTGPGRVVLSFESESVVGVMVTSSHPSWSSVTGSAYRTLRGQRGGGEVAVPAAAPSGDEPTTHSAPTPLAPTDQLWHLEISGNANFSRSADFVSLGERGIVEFVQLNAQHQPQLIWYRPLRQGTSPWS